MELINKFKNKKILLIIVVIATLIGVVAVMYVNGGNQEILDYEYSGTEKEIANKVYMYLPEYLSEETSARIVNTAVKSYDVIMEAHSVSTINDEHTDAIKNRIRTEILSYIDADISDDELDGLALGVTEIILNTILENVEFPKDIEYEKEYYYLVDSLQKQVDAIKEQKMKVTIRANTNSDYDIDADSLIDAINSLSSEDEKALKESLGIEAVEDGENGKDGANGKDGVNGKDGKDGINGRDGVNGKDGKDGINGRDGVNGKDGKDGADGKDGKDGEDGAFKDYEITSQNNNVFLFKTN